MSKAMLLPTGTGGTRVPTDDAGGEPATAGRGMLLVSTVVVTVAVAVRLLPVLRGGGLSGVVGYDDSVYYSAAVAFARGQLPYRDVLLLHPPGIVVALWPFAQLTGSEETTGLAAARVVWMLAGAGTAALVAHIVRRRGLAAATVAGLGYALYPAAVRVEQSTMLEGLANLCLAAALALLLGRRRLPGAVFWAGALLGVSAATKIWGIVPLLIVLGYLAVTGRDRAGRRAWLRCSVGALAGLAAICLPFFAAAPAAMWRMVVADQLGRPDSGKTALTRLRYLTGTAALGATPAALALTIALSVVIMAAAVVVLTDRQLRPAAVILLGITAVLLVSPSFFAHYAAAAAVPLTIVVGAAAATAADVVAAGRAGPAARLLPVAVLAVTVAVAAAALPTRVGHPLPPTVKAAVAPVTGCLTSDDPAVLLQLNRVRRNIADGCRTVVDLGGYSYDLSRGRGLARSHDPHWQRAALYYLRSGKVAVIARFGRGRGFSAATLRQIRSWPVLATVGHVSARVPQP